MTGADPIFRVSDVHLVDSQAAHGLVPLPVLTASTTSPATSATAPASSIQEALQSVADGTPVPPPTWQPTFSQTAFAISYVHAPRSAWDGRILRGKFFPDTKDRVVAALAHHSASACWLDQCLAQRKGDGTAGWAVIGLLPYATMPVLVVANFAPLHLICSAYVQLARLPPYVLSDVPTHVLPRLHAAWLNLLSSSFTPAYPQSHSDPPQFVNFVEMCRFWPMMERAMGHTAKGIYYEHHTLVGLRAWIDVLNASGAGSAPCSADSPAVSEHAKLVISDMGDVVYSILMQVPGEDHVKGLAKDSLAAITIVAGGLSSGALMSAQLYDPEDRNSLLLAGLCFNLLASAQHECVHQGKHIVQILNNPHLSFAQIAEAIPATYPIIIKSLRRANAIYNRPSLDLVGVPHATVTDEVTIFTHAAPSAATSRCWLGQWDLLPHLALIMTRQLVDIGERARGAPPYDDQMMHLAFTKEDVTGKIVRAVLAARPLTERHSAIPIIGISALSAIWELRAVEGELFKEGGLGGWTSTPIFLGICDTAARTFSLQAVVVGHMALLDVELLDNGSIERPEALKFVKNILRRSSSPLHKSQQIQEWVSSNFDMKPYAWYGSSENKVPVALHTFLWEKWVTRGAAASYGEGSTSARATFVKLSCVTVGTRATRPQLPLKDCISFVQAAMLLSRDQKADASSSRGSRWEWSRAFLWRVFETWLGLLTGLYRAHEVGDGVFDSADVKLLLPGQRLVDGAVKLCNDEVLERESWFMQGAARAGMTWDKLRFEGEAPHIRWDERSPETFWTARDVILDTAHMQSMMLTLMMICLITAAQAAKEERGPPQPAISPDGTTGLAGAAGAGETTATAEVKMCVQEREPLVNQLKTATRALARELSYTSGDHTAIISLLEHVVENARAGRDEGDWRVGEAVREAVLQSIEEGSGRDTALVELAREVFTAVDYLHARISHVKDAKIEVAAGQDYGEAVLKSLRAMLDWDVVESRETSETRAAAVARVAAVENDIRQAIKDAGLSGGWGGMLGRYRKPLMVFVEVKQGI